MWIKIKLMKKYIIYLLIATGLTTFNACKDMDSFHEPYLKNPTVYRAKPDMVFVNSGNKRAEVNWELSIDEGIVKTIITVDGVNTHIFPIEKQNGSVANTYTKVITTLTEGNHEFSIRNEDANGNTSLPVRVSTEVFGDNYQSSLSARGYNKITKTASQAKITWNTAYVGDAGLELVYINNSGMPITLMISKGDSETVLTDAKPSSTVTYKSFYKPNQACIDVFVVEKSFKLPL